MKLNQERVKMLADGDVVVHFETPRSLKKLTELLQAAFPSDNDKPIGNYPYYMADTNGEWKVDYKTLEPSHPVSWFYEDEPTQATTAIVTHIDRAQIATQIYCHRMDNIMFSNDLSLNKMVDHTMDMAIRETDLLISKLTKQA